MWKIEGARESTMEPAGGYDGTWHKWWLSGGEIRCFTVVKISRHAEIAACDNRLSERTLHAVRTHGRSEVERHLDAELPPRAIELASVGEPMITQR